MTDAKDLSAWPEYLNVPEVAEVLRVSKMTVYRMIHRGDFGPVGADGESPVIRTGRSFRITSKSLGAYLRATAVTS